MLFLRITVLIIYHPLVDKCYIQYMTMNENKWAWVISVIQSNRLQDISKIPQMLILHKQPFTWTRMLNTPEMQHFHLKVVAYVTPAISIHSGWAWLFLHDLFLCQDTSMFGKLVMSMQRVALWALCLKLCYCSKIYKNNIIL